jgi:hypothetical protein
MSSYWGNFLISAGHSPDALVAGLHEVPRWPAYDSLVDDALLIKDTVLDTEVETGLKKEECLLANNKIDIYIREYFPPQ